MSEQIRFVLAQQNFLLGAIEENAAKIIATAKLAREDYQADIVVFPELALTGYPPEDLLLRPELHQRVEDMIVKIQAAVPNIYVLFGHPHFDPETGTLFNCATLCFGGVTVSRYAKRHLPNYAVFDEKRYFAHGKEPGVIAIKGHKIGVMICEDVWMPGPVADCANLGAEFIFCINASPYHRNKALERVSTIHSRQVSEGQLPIVYLNLVGGQDELVFDGDSMIVDAQGKIPVRLAAFQEEIALVIATYENNTWRFTSESQASVLCEDAMLYQALVLGTRDYCHKNHFKQAIIGLSGGIDSALTVAIAADALGADNVTACAMPSRYTSDISTSDAEQQAKAMGVHFLNISIEPMFKAALESFKPAFGTRAPDVTEENLQARCRGITLMALSNKFGQIVLSTGNKSEIAVGYCTLYGDMCGGFDVLKDVPKTMVYRLSRYRNTLSPVIPDRVITRAPTAELRQNQLDQDSLPPYDILDPIMQRYVEEDHSMKDIIQAGFDEAMVRRVVMLIDRNEYKRRQSPPGPRISKRAFGRDWRYPITSGFGRR